MPDKSVVKEQDNIQNLKVVIDEMSSYIADRNDGIRRLENEINYLGAFITYHKLERLYKYFRENAHEEYSPELPFPTLTL